MALKIVAESSSAPGALPGITKSSTCSRDVFSGTADALVAAGLITREEMKPQKGRPDGCTAFLADGEPCPSTRRAWREVGFRGIRRLDDGTYRLEVTVSKEVQAWRRKAQAAAEYEAEQELINKELAESGHKYREWTLRHDFSGVAESWEGTKGQLQAVGIGVGLQFPGEPGAPEELHCKCPLGFDVRIHLPEYDRVKAAAGIYMAQSRYVPFKDEPKEYVAYASGVLLEVPGRWDWRSDTYFGTAQSLVDANLVPSLDFFPGRPGKNKCRASYRKDWGPATSSSREQDLGATICKRGKSRFSVEVPVNKAERERRTAQRDAREKDEKEQEKRIGDERRKLRQLASMGKGKTVEEFRNARASDAKYWLDALWRAVFCGSDGALSFDIPKDSELWDELGEAFQTIRDAVQAADVTYDKKFEAEVQKRLRLTAARNDKGVQSLLHDAKHLRLVHSSPEQ